MGMVYELKIYNKTSEFCVLIYKNHQVLLLSDY